MTTLGNVLLTLAFIGALGSVGALIVGDRLGKREGEGVTNIGYLVTFGVLAALTLTMLILLAAFFGNDYHFQYVVENHSTDVSNLAWLYKISGVWAGREGSLLLWAWLLSIYAAWVAYRRVEFTDRLSNMGLMVMNVIQSLFIAGLLFSTPNNPFKATPASWLGSNGQLLVNSAMNPLLQHWAMILHPPTLFIGYAGMAIPFAFAVAAIIINDGSSDWVNLIGRETIFAWLFLGAGIGLGAIWAYVVLGWGGYWAWDPVENASLLPWLTGVGLLHSMTVYRRRDGFKKWAIGLAGYSFALVILGTFITRSGIVNSVHAFEKDNFSLYLFLFMIVASVVVTVGGVIWRGTTFEGAEEFESLTSKEAAYYINNVIMTIAGTLVAYLTVSSALPTLVPFVGKYLPGAGQNFSAATYNSVAHPVGVLYVLLIAVCPLLMWNRTDGGTFWNRIKWPLVSAAIIAAGLMAIYWTQLLPIYQAQFPNASAADFALHNGEAVFGLLVAALLLSTTGSLFIRSARQRSQARGESFGAALWNILTKSRSQSGGYLAHIGMGIILIGLIGSAMYVRDVKINLASKPGAQQTVSGYTFKFDTIDQKTLANGDVVTTAKIDLLHNGQKVGTLTPGQQQFAVQGQTRLNASVVHEALKDVFVSLEAADQQQITLAIKLNPLISLTWLGFAILLLGTVVAVWPRRGARPLEVGAKAPAKGAKGGKPRSAAKPKGATR